MPGPRMRSNLIDTTTEHDVTAQQHRHHTRITDHAEAPAAHSDRSTHPKAHEQYKNLPEG